MKANDLKDRYLARLAERKDRVVRRLCTRAPAGSYGLHHTDPPGADGALVWLYGCARRQGGGSGVMWMLGGIGFTAPWLLVGALGAANPVADSARRPARADAAAAFPASWRFCWAFSDDEQRRPTSTPWWLLLLRMLAVAAIILGLAGPVLNPDPQDQAAGSRAAADRRSTVLGPVPRDWPQTNPGVSRRQLDQGRAGPVAPWRWSCA